MKRLNLVLVALSLAFPFLAFGEAPRRDPQAAHIAQGRTVPCPTDGKHFKGKKPVRMGYVPPLCYPKGYKKRTTKKGESSKGIR